MTRRILGALTVTLLWLAVTAVALTLATTTAVIVFVAVTIASFAVAKAVIEHREH